MNSIKFAIQRKKLKDIKKIISNKTLTPKEIQKAFKRKDITLEEMVIIALNNNKIDIIKDLSSEQIDELINSEADMTIYDTFGQLNNRQILKIINSKQLSIQEKMYLARNKSDINILENKNFDLEEYEMNTLKDSIIKRKIEILMKIFTIRNEENRFIEVFKKYNAKNAFKVYSLSDILNAKDNEFLTLREHMEYIFMLLEIKDDAEINENRFLISTQLYESPKNNIEQFKNLIDSDEEFKIKYFTYLEQSYNKIARYFGREDIETEKLSQIIYSIPLFQEKIVNPINTYKASSQEIFFNNFSEKNRHMIAYYDTYHDGWKMEYGQYEITMKNWYKKYYKDILSEKEQEDLINYSYENVNYKRGQYYSKTIDRIITCENVEYVLKQLTVNSNFFKEITKIRDSFLQGNLNDAIVFSRRYKQTPLYSEILEKQEIDKDLQEKIIYLSKKNRLFEVDTLKDLEEKTMEELKEAIPCLEPDSELVKAHTQGSGTGKTDKIIFNDSREIAIISNNGRESFLQAGNSHEGTLMSIYGEKLELNNKKVSGYKIACEAAKELNDIVFITEAETCIMCIPKTITAEQKDTYKKLISQVANIENIIWGISIVDGDNIITVDLEEYSKEYLTSNKFLGKYININEDNAQEQNSNSMSEITRQALEEYEPTKSEVQQVTSVLENRKENKEQRGHIDE